jgi:ABC-2 type transport system ATP-binding protein/lipopolysaccharide transport system ATP-binding protein
MRAVETDQVTKRYRIGDSWRPTLRDALSASSLLGRSRGASREFWALRGVSFSVDEGEVVGLIGRNGAGKTTLLKLLARITEPTSGVARMRGRVGALLEVGTGFHPELTGRENIFLNGAILGMRRSDIRRRFDEIVEFAGVTRYLDTPVKRYSSGMYLRLAFAVAAHVEPDIVVVDEVLAVGDAEFQKRCIGKMSQFAHEGRTVLFVSHDLGAIAQMCPRAIWLEGGTIKHDGSSARSIELYLAARGTETAQVEFPVEREKEVQLLSVGLTDEAGNQVDAPVRDRPFGVQVRFVVRENVGAVDVGIRLLTSNGVRVLEENWSDSAGGFAPAAGTGIWEVSLLVPPVLAANEYTVGVSLASAYETLMDSEVLTFRLWPLPDDRSELIERNRVVHVPTTWHHERTGEATEEAATFEEPA